jgi:putative transposase
MGLARSTFYENPAHSADDTAIVESMAAICEQFEHYGWRRVRAALRQQGLIVNHKKIRRLMRQHDLQPKTRRRFMATTDSNHFQPIFPNLAADVVPDGPDQLWVADITYVVVIGGFVYVAIVLDAWSRRVVDYAIGRLRTDEKTKAYVARRVAEGHSKLEAIRALKRYIAREVFAIIMRRYKEINTTRIGA